MAHIVFYEKPGCINNSRQKKRLQEAGHTVMPKNLLTEDWAGKPGQLREFFGDKPVADWFNRSAPAIKQGLVRPETLDAEQAIALMLAHPLLIRRPLMQVDQQKLAGFDEQQVHHWIGLSAAPHPDDLESCPNRQHAVSCHG